MKTLKLLEKTILSILLFTAFLAGYDYLKAKKAAAAKLETPKDIQILGITDKKDLDLCKDYQLDQKSDIEESQNIQQIIGYQNNKFGLYVYDVDNFVIKAAELVNSNGGDWGYVLIPYNVKEYNPEKWNKLFNTINEYRLIPVVQLWDVSEDPNDAVRDTKRAAEFLNSLNWPIEKKYISVYNEVNDSKFWKGNANPEEYAELLNETISIFKNLNEDFFIMNGAFNASARNGKGYIDEETFLIRMNQQVPGILKKLDGWASHPYPQPAFRGRPMDVGRDSIRAYEWELEILKNRFGIVGLPVFITETGWPHAEGESYNSAYLPEIITAKYLKQAFENIWLKDDRIVAVTPFTIKYDPPHDHFSWIKKDGSEYLQFKLIKDIPKTNGMPPIVEKYDPLQKKCAEQSSNFKTFYPDNFIWTNHL